jgi:cytochrome c553
MKKLTLAILVTLVTASVAMAQLPGPNQSTDILGAHNVGGRGCVICHAPHSGVLGNGKATTNDVNNGMYALWGQDLSPLYGQSLSFSGDGSTTKYPVTLPYSTTALTPSGSLTMNAANMHDADSQVIFCLSCHDGVLTKVGMMTGHTVETLPVVGGTAPTLLAAQAPSNGTAYSNDHPVGDFATVGCNAAATPESGYNWDCTGGGATTTPVSMTGTNSAKFLTSYPASFWNASGSPLSTGTLNGGTVNAVTCTTCHNQHSMTAYSNKNGTYSTMFFIKGYYNPNDGGNSVAQFCRNCHGGESNEMNGVLSVPTT